MNSSRFGNIRLFLTALLATCSFAVTLSAEENPLRFQRPGRDGQPSAQAATQQKFRAPSQSQSASQPVKVSRSAPLKVTKKVVAKPQAKQAAAPIAVQQVAAKRSVKQDARIRRAQSEEVEFETGPQTYEEEPIAMDSMSIGQPVRRNMAHHDGMMMGDTSFAPHPGHMSGCQCESCMSEPTCGVYDPGCGMIDPSCGCAEPSCGVAGVEGCGSCVGVPGPDYWCFPVCFPRLKDMTLWGGVHGFRGPRDFIPSAANPGGRSDSNFGFQEGINISGRAPLVGFLFPGLSYQLGYQAMQSRLSGTQDVSDDRGQQFVTGGVFRRTQSGLQFGVVWDSMTDDLDEQIDLNQVRYELSLKTPRGRELGFWGASSTNDAVSNNGLTDITYSTVDQYCGFYRWNFKDGYQARIWGGATGEGEGILGADVYAPINDRWSVQTGFNYLIPDQNSGIEGVSQESWNLGINLVWHLGRTAKKGCRSPFRPLFPVADNGWMFVDQVGN